MILPILVFTWSTIAAPAGAGDDYVSFPLEAPGLAVASPTLNKVGRQFARENVVATIVAAAAALQEAPATADERGPPFVVVVADVGKKGGGRFPPHQTHRDGRAVDILVPVLDDAGKPARFPHGDDDGFGYCARFDAAGRYVGSGWEGKKPVTSPFDPKKSLCKQSDAALPLVVDFVGIARMVAAIDSAAAARGLRVSRVIVAPEYVDKVLAANLLDQRLAATFVRHDVWTRHDDHVHIELAKASRK